MRTRRPLAARRADRVEASGFGKVPIERLAEVAPPCRISRARGVDAGLIVTAGGIASGMELGFHLLRRAGYDEVFIAEVARVMTVPEIRRVILLPQVPDEGFVAREHIFTLFAEEVMGRALC